MTTIFFFYSSVGEDVEKLELLYTVGNKRKMV